VGKPGNNVCYGLLLESGQTKKQLFPLKNHMEKQLRNIAKHSRKLQDFQMFPNLSLGYCLLFKNSLIIHEENTKKNHKRVVSLYVDKDFPSFTKL
jgi:hypothetical protein